LRLSEGLNLDRLAAVSGLQLEAGIVSEPFDAGFDRAFGPPRLARCSQASPKWPLAVKGDCSLPCHESFPLVVQVNDPTTNRATMVGRIASLLART